MPPSCHRSIALPQALGLCRTVQGHKSGPVGQVMPRRRCWVLGDVGNCEFLWVLGVWRCAWFWVIEDDGIWISSYYEVSKLAREKNAIKARIIVARVHENLWNSIFSSALALSQTLSSKSFYPQVLVELRTSKRCRWWSMALEDPEHARHGPSSSENSPKNPRTVTRWNI